MTRSVPREIEHRMKQYLLFRLLVTVLGFLLVAFYLACLPRETLNATRAYLYGLLACYAGIGVLSLLTFPRWRQRPRFYKQQVLIDFGLQAMLIWSTGGVVSIFTPVLFVTLAAATGVTVPRAAFALATLATVLLAATTVAFYFGLIPATSSWGVWVFSSENSVFIASYLVASIVGLYVISSLGSKLTYGLRHSENLRERIIENMAEGLVASDHEGRVIHLNGEARKLLGLPGDGDAYRQRPLADVLGEESGREPRNDAACVRLLEAFAAAERRRFEIELFDGEGRARPVEVKVSSVLDDKGRLRCTVGLFSDLTLKKEVMAAERRIQKLKELQVMAMGIAHEIRNPLASISGCVQELYRLSGDDPAKKRYSEIVACESARLDRIIEDFLRYARSGPLQRSRVDLVEVVEQAVVLLREHPGIGGRRVEWAPCSRPVPVDGDRDRLLQVVLNLGINAMEASPSQGGRLGIFIERCEFGKPRRRRWTDPPERVPGVELTVWDNGDGIAEGERSRVFTPFFTTKGTGSGLGLAIVESIVREHGGEVSIEEEGSGTVVRVHLPVADAAAVESVSPSPVSEAVGEVV